MSLTATCFYRRNPRWRITSHPEPDFGFSQASIVDDFSTVWNSAGAVDCTALHGVQNPFFAGPVESCFENDMSWTNGNLTAI